MLGEPNVIVQLSDDKEELIFKDKPDETYEGGGVHVKKVSSAENKALADAEFTIYDADGNEVQKLSRIWASKTTGLLKTSVRMKQSIMTGTLRR